MIATAHTINLRHLRAVLEVTHAGGVSAACPRVNMSQPALTQAIRSIEDQLNLRLFERSVRGMTATSVGARLAVRIGRALDRLNAKLPGAKSAENRPEVEKCVSTAQLRALIKIEETGSYSAAARAMGSAQPTVYRAARDLETGLGVNVFQRSASAVHLTRAGAQLAQNARLAFAEIDLGLLEIIEMRAIGAGRIRIGALPLARATILSRAIDRALLDRPAFRVHVDDGPYSDLLLALRTGALDLLVGALRDPAPSSDVTQELLFEDRLGVFCGPGHPLLTKQKVSLADLRNYPWVVPRLGTPTRSYFEAAFADVAAQADAALVETSSMILIRELLQSHERLTLISRAQVASEIRNKRLFRVPVALDDSPRPIGLTYRKDWYPTEAQRAFIEALRTVDKPSSNRD